MNQLGREIAQAAGADRAPVLGSGHPLADVFLLKHTPRDSEIHEGVAFYGRAGTAVLRSLQRLRVDETAIYGTNVQKYEGEGADEAAFWEAFKALRPLVAGVPPLLGSSSSSGSTKRPPSTCPALAPGDR